MSSFVSATNISVRQKKAEGKLRQFKRAYSNFINTWEQIETEENYLLKDLRKHVNKEKIKKIHDFINKLED